MPKEELITKDGKVEISSRWWKAVWPEEVKKPQLYTQMEKEIAQFEKQKRGRSKTQILITLTNISDFADRLKTDAKKNFNNYPNFKKSFERKMDKVATLAAAQKKLVADTGNRSTTIWKKDLATSVEENLKKVNANLASRIDFKSIKRIAEIKIPEIVLVELEERNADTQIYRELDKIHTSFGRKCAEEINTVFSSRAFITSTELKLINQRLEKWSKHFENAVKLVPDDVIAKIAIHKSIAAKYKRDRAIAITRAGAGVAISGAGIAAPGTQALAIAGLVRSCASLGKELASLAANIERKMIDLRRYIKALEKAYANGASKVTSELSLSMLNGALGIDVLPTLKKAQDDLDDVTQNFSLSYSKLQKKQKDILKIMKKIEKLESDLQNAALYKSKVKRTKAKLEIDNFEAGLNYALENAHESARRINKVERELPKLKQKLDALDKNPTALKVCSGLLKAAGGIAWSIAGTYDASNVASEMDRNVAIFMNSMSILSDIESEIEQYV